MLVLTHRPITNLQEIKKFKKFVSYYFKLLHRLGWA